MRYKRKRTGILLIALALLSLLAACGGSYPDEVTAEEVDGIVSEYFYKAYGMKVQVASIEYERVMDRAYRNFVEVFDGTGQYTLVLDEDNRPYADNVAATRATASIDQAELRERFAALDMTMKELYCNWDLWTKVPGCKVLCTAALKNLPDAKQAEEIHALLKALEGMGIDELDLTVPPPGFLNGRGANLMEETFQTNMQWDDFEAQYRAFSEKVSWDQEKFECRGEELLRAGYENVQLYYRRKNADTLEVVFCCTSSRLNTAKPAYALLSGMDDTFLRIDGMKVEYKAELTAARWP